MTKFRLVYQDRTGENERALATTKEIASKVQDTSHTVTYTGQNYLSVPANDGAIMASALGLDWETLLDDVDLSNFDHIQVVSGGVTIKVYFYSIFYGRNYVIINIVAQATSGNTTKYLFTGKKTGTDYISYASKTRFQIFNDFTNEVKNQFITV